MSARFVLLPDERFLPLRPALSERMAQIGRAITPALFPSICSPTILKLLGDAFRIVGASEGSVWIADAARQHLVIAHNTGPNAEKIIGFEQPLNKGIVSAVFASEQGMAENEVYKNSAHDKTLTERLQQVTYAMVAVPFYFLNECRGVISCVQLTAPGSGDPPPSGFSRPSLDAIQSMALAICELIDAHLLEITVGWKSA